MAVFGVPRRTRTTRCERFAPRRDPRSPGGRERAGREAPLAHRREHGRGHGRRRRDARHRRRRERRRAARAGRRSRRDPDRRADTPARPRRGRDRAGRAARAARARPPWSPPIGCCVEAEARRGSARLLDAPLVGREREHQRAPRHLRASRSRAPLYLFTLLGAAGVGKSRLARSSCEAATTVPPSSAGAACPTARASPSGRSSRR